MWHTPAARSPNSDELVIVILPGDGDVMLASYTTDGWYECRPSGGLLNRITVPYVWTHCEKLVGEAIKIKAR